MDERPEPVADEDISVFALGSALLRRRRFIVYVGLVGALVGLGSAIIPTRNYVSRATFLPNGTESSLSSLALAASQFGIRVPTSSATWAAPVYVELVRSRALLDGMASDTVTIREDQNRRVAVADLLDVKRADASLRTEWTVKKLLELVSAEELKKEGGVSITVRTKWPSVSYWMAEQLLSGVNRFNVDSRKSQAQKERVFVEAQASAAERALRAAEDSLLRFLQRNLQVRPSSPLEFERDRLRRVVDLRQQVYTTLAQNLEDARIREVRDIPVITVLESPKLPVLPASRGTVLKTLSGAIAGFIIGAFLALVGNAMEVATRDRTTREFFQLAADALPGWLGRRLRQKA